MFTKTFEHGDVRVTLHAPMIRVALSNAIEHALDRVLEGNTQYKEVGDLTNPRVSFPWLAANTKEIEGLDWVPLTLEDARDEDKVLQSFIQWLCVVDTPLYNHWCDEVNAMNKPADEVTGPEPLPVGADPNS